MKFHNKEHRSVLPSLARIGLQTSLQSVRSLGNKFSALALLVMFFIPVIALGETSTNTSRASDKTKESTANTSPFCASITKTTGNINTRLNTQVNNLEKRQTESEADKETKRNNIDSKLKDVRDQGLIDRQAQFAKLEARATTDAQKQAVKTFESSLLAAIATREASANVVMDAFRTGVDQAVAANKKALLDAKTAYESAVNDANQKAVNGCASNPKTTRVAFQASMQAANKALQASRAGVEKLGSQVEKLAKIRNAAVKDALQTFKTTAENLAKTLKAVFAATTTP